MAGADVAGMAAVDTATVADTAMDAVATDMPDVQRTAELLVAMRAERAAMEHRQPVDTLVEHVVRRRQLEADLAAAEPAADSVAAAMPEAAVVMVAADIAKLN